MFSDTPEQQIKVDFLIAGVQKGGTTTLDYYLRQHQQVCMADRKEVHFFDNEKLFASNIRPDYNFYHSFFSPNSSSQLIGESTPIYSYWKNSASRIHAYNPQMKIILVLRNPIDRAYSHWNKETINYHSFPDQEEAAETLPFLQALKNEKIRCSSALPLQHRYYSYIDRGFYTQQLRRLMNYFPRQQLLILKSEKLWHQTEETLNQVYDFLNIEPQALPEIRANESANLTPQIESPVNTPEANPINTGNYKRKMSEAERDYLLLQYTDEIHSLEEMLNWDCSDWLM